MKIGIVTQSFYPAYGGVTEHVYATYRGLKDMGHDVKIMTSSFGKQRDGEHEDVIRLGRNRRVVSNGAFVNVCVGLSLSQQVKDVLQREKFDLLHLHQPLVPTLPLLFLHHSQTVNIGSFHACYPRSLYYRFCKEELRGLYSKLHGKIAGSMASRNSIRRYFPGEYAIIPYGINLARFSNPANGFSNEHDDVFNILFVGRIDPRKGLKYLLEAFPAVLGAFPNARLTIVGDGPLRSYYETLSVKPKKGMRRKVIFTGRVAPQELPSYYAQSHLFCAPAVGGESFGIVLLEAMASGLPIIASDIDGYRDVVTHTREGLLVKPRSPSALAEAICEVLQDKERREGFSQAGRLTSSRYSYQATTANIEAYYHQVLRQTGNKLEP